METFYYTCIENASSLKMFGWFCFLDCLHLLQYKFSGCVSVGPSWHAIRGNGRIRFARCCEDTVKGKVFPLQARLCPRGWVEV